MGGSPNMIATALLGTSEVARMRARCAGARATHMKVMGAMLSTPAGGILTARSGSEVTSTSTTWLPL